MLSPEQANRRARFLIDSSAVKERRWASGGELAPAIERSRGGRTTRSMR
jgi:hypothetical protein